MPAGPLPTLAVCTTRLVAGSILETVPSRLFTTQTAPLPTTIPVGLLPTVIVWTRAFETGSILETLWSSALVTQIAPSPTAMCDGVAPTPTFATKRPEWGSTTRTESPATGATSELLPLVSAKAAIAAPIKATVTATAVSPFREARRRANTLPGSRSRSPGCTACGGRRGSGSAAAPGWSVGASSSSR